MAKLYLKFEQAVLKEFLLSDQPVTIGRLPDNTVYIDNPAVSGHHARITKEGGQYFLEDLGSTNHTYVNGQPITRVALKDGDSALVAKHTIVFQDEAPKPVEKTVAPAPPRAMEATMVLDTKAAKEMLANRTASIPPLTIAAPAGAAAAAATAVAPAKERVGMLTVIEGKTDHPQYVLTGKMSIIGKNEMASIKLKGLFAPNTAALISKTDNKYFIAASEAKIRVKINGEEVSGRHELHEGDMIDVAGVKMNFGFQG